MSSSRRMDHMTWPEIEASKSKPVIVPIGSTEQHSQHLPLGVDAMIASHVSEDLAERIDGIVAPTMNYGYKSKPLSGGGPLFPGTIDMNGVTVINQMHDVLGELIAGRFHQNRGDERAFRKRGIHYRGNRSDQPSETRGVATIVRTNCGIRCGQNVVEQVFRTDSCSPDWALEHAAVTETSLMMHYEPELVHMDRVIDEGNVTPKAYVRYPVRKGDVPDYGGLATPAGSSAERGKLIVDACIDAVADICATEFGE